MRLMHLHWVAAVAAAEPLRALRLIIRVLLRLKAQVLQLLLLKASVAVAVMGGWQLRATCLAVWEHLQPLEAPVAKAVLQVVSW